MTEKEYDRGREIEQRALEYQRNFSYERFRVIRKELFAHLRDPAVTFRPDGITFNASCIAKLEDVVYIKLLVDNESKHIAIKQCDENDKNAIRWCIAKQDGTRKSRFIRGKDFTRMIYGMMGWEDSKRYKVMGFLLDIENEAVFLFDLTMTEKFEAKKTKRKKTVKEATQDGATGQEENINYQPMSTEYETATSMPSSGPEFSHKITSTIGETVEEDAMRTKRQDLAGFAEVEK